jgi:hypothetical protein
MKFAKILFWIAGAYGVLVLAPLYFLFDMVGRQDPPPLTHPQFYYGFVGVALAWQIAFFVIATDPARFRPIMIPSALEKITYAGAILVLCQQGRIAPAAAITGVPDALLALLFLVAFFKTKPGR